MLSASFRIMLLVSLGVCLQTSAYELQTHRRMSESAFDRSILANSPDFLKRYGVEIGRAIPIDAQLSKRPRVLVSDGSEFEDTDKISRVFHHFYNPATGKPLTVGTELGFTSPDWALEDKGQLTSAHSGEQRFSYREARRYLYEALTYPTPSGRDQNWALAFQSLGHVIHHIQDMAQPQHVRNDAHCGPFCANAYPESAYEIWTELNRGELPLDPAIVGYDVTSERYRGVFDRPRSFWHTQSPERLGTGQGMAEFTHRNFVSAGTLFKPEFASPTFDITKSIDFDIRHLMPGTPLDGTVRFFISEVRDEFLNVTQSNAASLSESVFDAELLKSGRQPVFSLNRFTFQAAHAFLIPRAVAHSTGLINYFFRVDFEIVRDGADASKFRIRNRTSEPMSGHLALYQDNAAGQRARVTGQEWTVQIPAYGESAPLGTYPSAGKFTLVFDGGQGAEVPENGSLGAVGAQTISRCIVGPSDGGFSHRIADPATGREWDGKTVYLADGGAQSQARIWEVILDRYFFAAQIQPHVTTVVFAVARNNAPAELVTFVVAGSSPADDTTQYFVLPDYMSDAVGWPRMEEVCS